MRLLPLRQLRQTVVFEHVRQLESQTWHVPGVPNCPSGQFRQLRSNTEQEAHPYRQAVQLLKP